MKPNLARSAHWYARQGWEVFPCWPRTKAPMTKHGWQDATTDLDRVRWWWNRTPQANIGVHCGGSGFLALDLDEYKDSYSGAPFLSWDDKETVVNLTGNGGTHLLYSTNEKYNNERGDLPDGIDVRGWGGYIIVPPSIHPDTGRAYMWEIGYGPHEHAILPMPPGLATVLQTARLHQRQCGPPSSAAVAEGIAGVEKLIATLGLDTYPPIDYDEGGRKWLLKTCPFQTQDNPHKTDRGTFILIARDGHAAAGCQHSALPATAQDPPPVWVDVPLELGVWASGSVTMPTMPYLTCEVNDEGNAECLFLTVGHLYHYCHAYGFMYWNGKYWDREDAQEKLEHDVVKMLRKRIEDGNRNKRDDIVKACVPHSRIVNAIIAMFRKHVIVKVDAFDANPYTLNCQNGEIDLRTGALTPHDPSMLYTYCTNAEYNPHADTTKWEEWLASTVEGGMPMVRYLQILCGYIFTGLTREELFVYIFGPTRSGKGTFTETLLALAGRPIGIAASMSTFTDRRSGSDQNFDLAALKASRFVVASESESTDWLNAAKIKNMTGGDWITCAFKHKDQFSYRPIYTIMLVSNHPVQTDAEDDAIWGRARVICFPHSHLGKEDKHLKDRMKSPENLEAVLNWIVWGAVAYCKDGLNTPEIVAAYTEKARSDVDYVGKWMDDNIIISSAEDFTSATVLYQNYKSWCEDMGAPVRKQRGFANSLQAKGIAPGVVERTPLGVRRVVHGVKIIAAA